jgi:HD-GYP domain-containing protein (c-di-GMP phosphodiesterase class II)
MGAETLGKTGTGRLELLLEVGKAFNSVIDLDRLLAVIADKTAEFLDAERCSIFVVDSDKRTLWTKASMGAERIVIPLDTGIAGAVVTTGSIINVSDAYKDARFNREIDVKTGYRTKAILAGPMLNHSGELLGVFQLLNSRHDVFTAEDESMLQALSGFAANALENAMLFEELKTSFYSVLAVMAATVDAKHPYTAGHTARVAEYSSGIGQVMGLTADDLEVLRVAAYLHDYGKIGIRDAVLTKPGKLTDDEFKEMREHAAKTRSLLNRMHFSKKYRGVPDMAGAHHEKFDGNGYPQKLAGVQIPLGARILAAADVFDALTSDRDYRAAMPPIEALDIMRKDIGRAFDPTVFAAFEAFVKNRFGL